MSALFLRFEEQFFLCLACLGGSLRDGRISDGDDDDRFLRVRHLEEFVAALSIEITNPTGAEPLLCSSQAKMLHSDGNIDIAVWLAVGTNPLLLMEQRSQDVKRCFVEPRARIAGLKFLPTLLTADNTELPGLTVHSRWCQTHAFLDILQLLFFNRLVEVSATTIAATRQV